MQKPILYFLLLVSWTCLAANPVNEFKTALAQKQYQSALDIIQPLIFANSDNAHLHFQSALAYFGLKNYHKAEEYSAQAVIKALDISEHHRLFADAMVANYFNARQLGIFKLPSFVRRVKRSYLKAVALDPDNLKARERMAMFYTHVPLIMGRNYQKAEAEIAYIENLDMNKAYQLKISLLKKRERMQDALKLINVWKKHNPQSWKPQESLFFFYYQQKKYPQAEKILTNWLLDHPREMDSNYLLGMYAADTGRLLSAGEQALLKYASEPPEIEQPGHEWAYFRLAQIYLQKNERSKAVKASQKARNLQPTNKKIRDFHLENFSKKS